MKTQNTTLNFSKNTVIELNQNQLNIIKGGSIVPLITTIPKPIFDPIPKPTTNTIYTF